jgi:hypothetical protein
MRSWPLLVLAVPAAVAVWSGWMGIGRMTGFGLVRPLPGIWDSLRIETAVTLPVGVEAYAAYALRAWLAPGRQVSRRTRRFAGWSAMARARLAAEHTPTRSGVPRAEADDGNGESQDASAGRHAAQQPHTWPPLPGIHLEHRT